MRGCDRIHRLDESADSGEMPERPKGVDSKSTVSLWHRGFESLSLRHFNKKFGKLPFYTLPTLFYENSSGHQWDFSHEANLRPAWLRILLRVPRYCSFGGLNRSLFEGRPTNRRALARMHEENERFIATMLPRRSTPGQAHWS